MTAAQNAVNMTSPWDVLTCTVVGSVIMRGVASRVLADGAPHWNVQTCCSLCKHGAKVKHFNAAGVCLILQLVASPGHHTKSCLGFPTNTYRSSQHNCFLPRKMLCQFQLLCRCVWACKCVELIAASRHALQRQPVANDKRC